MITWRMAAAWVLALILVTVLTWQIVGLADSQVGTPVAVAPSPPSTTVGGSTSTSAVTSTSATSPTTTVPETTSTSSSRSTPTTTASSNPSTSPSSSTSTTATSAEWSSRTITSPGGTVVVRHRPEEVELQAATPAPGFSVEVEDDGPTRVRVEFESEAADFQVEARWEDGGLDVEIDG